MTKYGPRSLSIATYDTAMRRADRAIRRGLKQDAAYWMKIADHAHRIASRARDAEAIRDRIKRALDQHRRQAGQ